MPKFLGMDKKRWLWIGLAAAAVVAYMLLSRGSGGGGSAAPAEQPIQGGNTGGYPAGNTPAGGFFDSNEKAASQYSQDLLGQSQQLVGAFFNGGLYQAVPGGFVNTGKKKPGAKGTFIPYDLAVKLGPQNKGPLAQPKSGYQKAKEILDLGATAYSDYSLATGGGDNSGGDNSWVGGGGGSSWTTNNPGKVGSGWTTQSRNRRV